MGEETKKIDHNENIANGVLKQSDFCISSPILYKERNVHEDSKNFFLENCPTNMTLYSRSSSLRPMLSVTSNTDATKLYLVDENKTSLEGLSTTISNNTVGDSLEYVEKSFYKSLFFFVSCGTENENIFFIIMIGLLDSFNGQQQILSWHLYQNQRRQN
jgi:hypothetical protein